jgi:cytochrome c oxidase subunit 2
MILRTSRVYGDNAHGRRVPTCYATRVKDAWGLAIVAAVVGCGAAAPATDGITMFVKSPPDALELGVRVSRHSCAVTDPQGVTDWELHVPTGRAVRLVLANTDTIDALDVAVGTRRVNVPRQTFTYIAFQIDRAGSYIWQCPTASSNRPLVAQSPAQYAAYQATRVDPLLITREDKIALGRKLYGKKGCNNCHTLDGTPRVGPSWKGIWGKNATLSDGSVRMVDESYVRESIFKPVAFARPGYPQGVMPTFEGQLKPHELDALVTLISSLAD